MFVYHFLSILMSASWQCYKANSYCWTKNAGLTSGIKRRVEDRKAWFREQTWCFGYKYFITEQGNVWIEEKYLLSGWQRILSVVKSWILATNRNIGVGGYSELLPEECRWTNEILQEFSVSIFSGGRTCLLSCIL